MGGPSPILFRPETAEQDRAHAQRRERTAVRTAEQLSGLVGTDWTEDFPGQPLGHGMPMGRPLRLDGESHANAWRRILRADPCTYCGGQGGTVDHVVPQASRRAGVQRWPNLVGACTRCNGRKRAKPMLRFLLERLAAP